ncbi:hypothetical protein F4823DRAFT_577033 [Ustulina deusta]|nr:hypothetical protein F4823DRAFT_577033 [Ustulina deusta]
MLACNSTLYDDDTYTTMHAQRNSSGQHVSSGCGLQHERSRRHHTRAFRSYNDCQLKPLRLRYYVSGWLSSRVQIDCCTTSGRLVAPNVPLALLQYKVYGCVSLLLIGLRRGTAEPSPRICHVITLHVTYKNGAAYLFCCICSAQPQAE